MEGSLVFLFAAVLVTLVAIFLYLMFLGGRLAALRRDLEALKRDDTWGEEEERGHRVD